MSLTNRRLRRIKIFFATKQFNYINFCSRMYTNLTKNLYENKRLMIESTLEKAKIFQWHIGKKYRLILLKEKIIAQQDYPPIDLPIVEDVESIAISKSTRF